MNIKEIREINIFAAVLVIQAIPFLAAVGLATIERSRLNDFATWRAIETKVAELLPVRPAVAKLPTSTTPPAKEQRDLVP